MSDEVFHEIHASDATIVPFIQKQDRMCRTTTISYLGIDYLSRYRPHTERYNLQAGKEFQHDGR